MPFSVFLSDPMLKDVPRVSGTAVYLSKNPYGVPRTLLHNFKHNKVFHERIIILTLYTEAVPRVYGTDCPAPTSVLRFIHPVEHIR